ncbi:GNAT family N-acetyltransferase [soil metagenome]
MPAAQFWIEPARTEADMAGVAELFRAYAESLGIDLGYQGFEAELASLPGNYAPPQGELLLARDGEGEPVGCVAVKPILPERCCEMKRLYVAPRGRGVGLGKALMNAILETAAHLGYREMRLDTLPSLVEAVSLYRMGGFEEIPPYYDTPVEGTIFMGRRLP